MDRYDEPTLNTTDVIRQHYVPKMLLASFAADGQIPTLDLETGKLFLASLDKVAVEKHFYDIRAGQRVFSAETWLTGIESKAAPVIKRLIANPESLSELSDDDENHLGRFIAAQDFRGPGLRELVDNVRDQGVAHAKSIVRHMLEENLEPESVEAAWQELFADEPDEYWLGESGPYQSAQAAAFMLSEVQGFCNVLRAMPWRIVSAAPGLRFYTSDDPVSRIPLPSARWPVYFEHIYYLPLAPTTMLMIGPGAERSGRGARLRGDDSPWHVVLVNSVTTTHASRFLYGRGPYLDRLGAVITGATDTKTC